MKKKKIKLCLTKQLLNMFKLWCEWGKCLGDLGFRKSRDSLVGVKSDFLKVTASRKHTWLPITFSYVMINPRENTNGKFYQSLLK